MIRTIFVGDLHGKYEIAEYILTNNTSDKIIFVGDYLDSFDRSIDDQVKTLEIVLEATKAEPDRVIGIIGNHEYSYLNPQIYGCSGFSPATMARVLPLISVMRERLLNAYVDGNSGALVTHAGVTQVWLDMIDTDENDLWRILSSASEDEWNMVGKARRGFYKSGGPVWCDYWAEFKPISGINQVFGHTRQRNVGELAECLGVVTQDGENFNIDCLDTSDEVLAWSPELGFYPIDYRDL